MIFSRGSALLAPTWGNAYLIASERITHPHTHTYIFHEIVLFRACARCGYGKRQCCVIKLEKQSIICSCIWWKLAKQVFDTCVYDENFSTMKNHEDPIIRAYFEYTCACLIRSKIENSLIRRANMCAMLHNVAIDTKVPSEFLWNNTSSPDRRSRTYFTLLFMHRASIEHPPSAPNTQ